MGTKHTEGFASVDVLVHTDNAEWGSGCGNNYLYDWVRNVTKREMLENPCWLQPI
jgi:hypothetical protein